MKRKIKVHIADDHKILIEGVIALINTDDDIEVEGYSLTGKEVVSWSNSNEVDVLILDINMPELDGIQVLKAFKNRNHKQKTIILSGLSDPKLVQEMMNLGASGFIDKSSASKHIIKAVKMVDRGFQYLSEELKIKMMDLIENGEQVVKLSPKEVKIIKLITQEKSIQEIADKLKISEKTVESYRTKLYQKLKVKNAVGLAMYAVNNKII